MSSITQLNSVKDIYGNHYLVVSERDFMVMEHSEMNKNDFFGYINKNGNFVSCKKHKDKNPQALFVVADEKLLNSPITKTKSK